MGTSELSISDIHHELPNNVLGISVACYNNNKLYFHVNDPIYYNILINSSYNNIKYKFSYKITKYQVYLFNIEIYYY